MSSTRLANTITALGAIFAALGLGAQFAEYLSAYAIPLIGGGFLIHAIGHALQYKSWRARQ